jgi:maleate cis-trans isomerase
MASANWRGTVGVVKPTYESGSLVEFIRLLPEGGPPFMVRGYKSEREIVRQWEEKYHVPIFTSGMTQAEALRALAIKKFVGCTYFRDKKLNDIFSRYFTDAGFAVLGMEGMDTSPGEAGNLSTEAIYRHLKRSFLKHPGAEGVYLLGSGAWRAIDVVAVEEDIRVPVVHPVAARVWYVQKRLHVHQPVQGVGRLLAELP